MSFCPAASVRLRTPAQPASDAKTDKSGPSKVSAVEDGDPDNTGAQRAKERAGGAGALG